MITAKFGGTAITPTNLHFIKSCISKSHNVVVVSAIGKEFYNDVKATDLLKNFYLTRNNRLWQSFADKYRRLVYVNSVGIDVDELLFDARSRAVKYNLEYCMSLGEELSAKIVAKYLSATYVEAEQIVHFSRRGLRLKDTLKSMCNAFDGVGLAVTGGFYGSLNAQRQLFSRGGSDITGSLCAAATGANLYENWTDSYGVTVADPAKVFDVSTVFALSYDQMFDLAQAGAQVLNPSAVMPCKQFGIPIKIGNYYNPCGSSTLISNCRSHSKILSIAEKLDGRGNTVTTILFNLDRHLIVGFMSDFFKRNQTENCAFGKMYICENVSVMSFTCRQNILEIVTSKSIVSSLYKQLKAYGFID